jgi:hypothetical protein
MPGVGGVPGAPGAPMTAQNNPMNNPMGIPMLNNGSAAQNLYMMLVGLMLPQRYNRLFEHETPDGQFVTRDEVARAIIDWSDVDEQRFEPLGPSSANEDYRYETLRDPYRAHNHFYDTVEELNLVRGVGDDFWGSFGELFTIYGGCQVNLSAVNQSNWPILSAIVRASAANPSDPTLLDDTVVAALAQQLAMYMMMMMVPSMDSFAKAIANGGVPPMLQGMMGGAMNMMGMGGGITPMFPGLSGVKPDAARLQKIASYRVPRQVFRMDSVGTVCRSGNCSGDKGKKVQVHIRAIFDTRHFNANTLSADINDRLGTWVYWRME